MGRAGLDPEIVAEAAASIVNTSGTSALSLTRLAADLGVAPPSLYKHVAGLEDVLGRVTTLAIRRLAAALTVVAIGRSGRQALLAVGNAYRQFALENAGLYPLVQGGGAVSMTAQQVEADRVLGVMDATVRSYGVPDRLTVDAVRLVRSSLHGFADIEAKQGFQMPQSVDGSFAILIDALDSTLSGLAHTAGSK